VKVAVLIAVANYADPRLRPLPFAEADIKALASVLQQQGFAELDRVLLQNEEATKASLESRLTRILKGLGAEDELLLYFAGYAHAQGPAAFLTCYDSDPQNLVRTSIGLDWLGERCRSSDCGKLAVLLDLHGDLPPAGDRHALSLRDAEANVAEHFDGGARAVCLAACRFNETSHASGALRHGIWAYHLVEAFAGDTPGALVNGSQLTAASLQKYLQREVPRTLTKTFPAKKAQTPWMAGNGQLLLADLSDLLARRKAPADPSAGQTKNLTLVSQRVRPIRSLSGFEKTFRQPDRANSAADAFVARIAGQEITDDIHRVFAELKGAFRFKRADLHIANHGDGAATIITPFFNYSIAVRVNREDPSQATFRRTVDAIKEPAQLGSAAFERVFKDTFDTIEFDLPTLVDLPAFIDRLEEADDGRIRIDYGPEATCCTLYVTGLPGTVQVTARSVSIVHVKPDLPASLLRSLYEILNVLREEQAGA
jgi:hypothetical protein